MPTKICSRCKETKARTLFGHNSRTQDGLDYYCLACRTEVRTVRRKTPIGREAHLRHNLDCQRNLRAEVLEVMGNKCARCGFADWRALQIDHVNGGGTEHRKTNRAHPVTYLREVREAVLAESKEFQLLCANCNWIKRYENKEHRGSPRR